MKLSLDMEVYYRTKDAGLAAEEGIDILVSVGALLLK